MFTKLLKHDLRFNHRAFVATGFITLVMGIIGRIALPVMDEHEVHFLIGNIAGVTMLITFIIAFVQIKDLFSKNLYENSGYLMLTLPVTRRSLILSKLVACWIWYTFIFVAGLITIFIIRTIPFQYPELLFRNTLIYFAHDNFRIVTVYIQALSIVFFIISFMFLAITINNSSFKNYGIPAIITGILGVSGITGYLIGMTLLSQRFTWRVVEQISGTGRPPWLETPPWLLYSDAYDPYGTWSMSHMSIERLVGLEYGRLPISSNTFLDLWLIGISVGLGILFLVLGYYLLKKHVSL